MFLSKEYFVELFWEINQALKKSTIQKLFWIRFAQMADNHESLNTTAFNCLKQLNSQKTYAMWINIDYTIALVFSETNKQIIVSVKGDSPERYVDEVAFIQAVANKHFQRRAEKT